jgi:phosphate transport system substrate-binding protein
MTDKCRRQGLARLALSVVGLSLVLLSGCKKDDGGGSNEAKRLEGAGSTFVDPIMQEWSGLYQKEKSVEVNYQPKGSGAGIAMMTEKKVDFGCSDAPLNVEQLAKARAEGGEVLHIPLCMGGIVLAYNLPGDPELTFDAETLIHIYLGDIKKWNDDRLKKLNPKADLPDLDIAVTYRSDSSGSTYILTDYFVKVSEEAHKAGQKDFPEWKPGRGTAIKFPVGTGSKGTDGVAGYVKQTRGAIGYVELIYALKNSIPYGAVKNQKGKAIKADMKSVTAAAATAEIPPDLRYSITNSPGEDAYPIAGTVWAIVYVKQPADKAKPLADFLTWITHDGQRHCSDLHYATLPEGLVHKIEEKIKLIEAAK